MTMTEMNQKIAKSLVVDCLHNLSTAASSGAKAKPTVAQLNEIIAKLTDAKRALTT